MKYNILGKEFNSKKDLSDFCIKILIDNLNTPLKGDDKEFMLEIFKYHPRTEAKLLNIQEIIPRNWNDLGYCFYINNGLKEIDISFHKCINHIPFSNNKTMDFIFDFGKYIGQSIYDINDESYLRWCLTLDKKSKSFIKKINQFLKYGYVPFDAKDQSFTKVVTVKEVSNSYKNNKEIDVLQKDINQLKERINDLEDLLDKIYILMCDDTKYIFKN